MIDRLELKTNLYGHFIESRNKSIPKGTSQLMEEDTDLIELKRSDLNPLYRQAITHTILETDGQPHDDPVKFYIFTDPRFKKQKADRYKIALNPNKTPYGELVHFLRTNFQHRSDNDDIFFDEFKIGRIDLNVDIDTHTVQELFKLLYLDSKARNHTAIFSDPANLELDSTTVRTIGSKEMETFYIGKGGNIFRVYNKVKEARHRIAILKGQEQPIPAALQEMANREICTRLEMQIRDLYRAGTHTETEHTRTIRTSKELRSKFHNVETEKNLIFEPTRAYHNIKTFNDLVKIRRDQFDFFSAIKFKPADVITLHKKTKRESAKQKFLNQQWIIDSFNALIDAQGYDTALKKLDPDTRREVKRRHIEKQFKHDLNEECFKSIIQWIHK